LIPWAEKIGVTVVSVDEPDLPGLFPSGLTASHPGVYVRLHSRNADNWYRGEASRYDYDYTDAELNEWIDALARTNAERAVVAFNNCHNGRAAVNGLRLRVLLDRRAEDFHVVEPFAASPPVQPTLFD
jgi:uncharacterized protein YecE (DUF72 family)